MDNHIIFEPVTDMDKNIGVLADTKAECTYKQHFGICNMPCDMCDTHHNLLACYNQLAVCDRLRVDNEAHLLALRRVYFHKRAMYEYTNGKRLLICLAIFLLMLFCGGVALVRADTYIMKAYKNDTMITNTLRTVKHSVRDVNKDNVINCIDYAVQFKREWDKKYAPENCEIVRNKNPKTGFHHLFIRCRNHSMANWVYIEPQGSAFNYSMYDTWKDDYNPYWNRYNETNVWLRRCGYD